MKLEDREEIEWTNCWWSKANNKAKRCLLIGDSTTRQIRGSVEKLLTNVYAVDLFAASFSILDKRLMDNLKVFFKGNEYIYDVIVVHYGGHHGFSKRCSTEKIIYKMYYQKYTKLIRFLYKKCKNIVVVTGTSEVMENDVSVIDVDKEDEIVIRNKIVLGVAKEQKCDVFDLYAFSKEHDSRLRYMDRQHFGRESDYYIAYSMLNFMMKKELLNRELIEKQCYNNKKALEEMMQEEIPIYIYGAGIVGQELFWFLKWNGLRENIKYFIVTNQSDSKTVWDIPVIAIEQVSEKEKQEGLLIISSEKYADEMYVIAKKRNFSKIMYYYELERGDI